METRPENITLVTQRLTVSPLSDEELTALRDSTVDEELRQAYGEMLEGCQHHSEERLWYTAWRISLKNSDGGLIGDLCFKGLGEDGRVEIGYGMVDGFEGHGYMTEAVKILTDWALAQPGVTAVTAETDPDNKASQRILEKLSFVPTGEMGKEGPRFILYRR